MTALIVIACVVGYIAVASMVFGYVESDIQQGDPNYDGFDTLHPTIAGVLWPLILTALALVCVMIPAKDLGSHIEKWQTNSQKKRADKKDKIRIELEKSEKMIRESEQEAERALEDQFRALDRQERNRR